MVDVIFINPKVSTRRMPPLGILYIASYLEQNGVSVQVLDQYSSNTSSEDSVTWMIKHFEGKNPKYVGITCMTNQWNTVRVIAHCVKVYSPGSIVVVGGVHPTVSPKEVLRNRNVDIIVIGEGEKAMLKIVKECITKGVVMGEAFSNLDDKPLPAWHLINMKKYTERDTVVPFHWIKGGTLITSLGCKFNCLYCINSKRKLFEGIRYNSISYVEKEVEFLVSEYGIEGIYFQDDDFLENKPRAIELSEMLRKFNLKWVCAARVDSINEEVLSAISSSGCVGIGFGVESGSPRVLKALNKHMSIDDAIVAFDLCKKYNLKTYANIIIGCPEETTEDIALTDILLSRIKPDYVQVNYATPYKGTAFYDMALTKGWVKEDSNLSFRTCEPQIEINFTIKELSGIGRYFENKYNSFPKKIRPYLSWHFLYDMIRLVKKEPSLITKGFDDWVEASRRY